jgi:hypothetical protein
VPSALKPRAVKLDRSGAAAALETGDGAAEGAAEGVAAALLTATGGEDVAAAGGELDGAAEAPYSASFIIL